MESGDGARRRYENGFRNDMEMKIMIFSIKLDKFTGFFDKFLKNDVHIKHCNKKSYNTNLSVLHSDSAAKKFFASRAFPRNSPHLRAAPHQPSRAFWGRSRRRSPIRDNKPTSG